MDRLLLDRGWKVDVAVGSVMGRWPEIVGPEVAQHCTPVTFEMGVLTVRADSTAWATQLRLLSPRSWAGSRERSARAPSPRSRSSGRAPRRGRAGPRRSQGPGPRDTYG